MRRVPRWPVLLLLGAGLIGCAAEEDTARHRAASKPSGPLTVGTQVGQKAPEITGTDLRGDALKLSEFRGQVVVLSFWAST